MTAKMFIWLMVAGLFIAGTVFVAALPKASLTQQDVQAKWAVYGSLMTKNQICQTVQKESLMNVPQQYRTFPYLQLKDGVNCLDG